MRSDGSHVISPQQQSRYQFEHSRTARLEQLQLLVERGHLNVDFEQHINELMNQVRSIEEARMHMEADVLFGGGLARGAFGEPRGEARIVSEVDAVGAGM